LAIPRGALGCSIGTPLADINLGFTRRQVAFGGCGKAAVGCGGDAAVFGLDKELETEGSFL
jgi:hypothetical protein